MPEYRVNLEIYNGPLDLLLYLIRREEVDIYDIPIARITEQYVQYVDLIRQLDPNLAGDFLVMAATLLEIKTHMLLPSLPADEGGPEGLEIDPRAELVRQLLEYKAFKDAAGDLLAAAQAKALRFPRRPAFGEDEQHADIDLEDAQVWDLLDAFSKLMAAIGADKATHHVIYDDTPIELHQADIVDRLQREGPMTFRRIFEGLTDRILILGLFLALLELVRQRKVACVQEANFGQIVVDLRPEEPTLLEKPDHDAGTEAQGTGN
jgi:segregation and condensation protein A